MHWCLLFIPIGSYVVIDVVEYIPGNFYLILFFDPLSPHDALKHHFTPLKTYLIFLQPRVLKT